MYKSFVGELAMHLQEVDKDSAASGEARLRVERMIEDKVQCGPPHIHVMVCQAMLIERWLSCRMCMLGPSQLLLPCQQTNTRSGTMCDAAGSCMPLMLAG